MPIEWTNEEDGIIRPKDRRNYIAGIFSETTYGEMDGKISVLDILFDLQHYCHLEKIDFDDALRIARDHFQVEVNEEKMLVQRTR